MRSPGRGSLRMRSILTAPGLTLALLVLSSPPGSAAPGASPAPPVGVIAGTVMDNDGAGVPFASVVIEGTRRGTQTSEAGHFTISNVPVGTYSLLAHGMGHAPSRSPGIAVNAGRT